ncbi:MAG: type II secretion system F family protein [Alphaproteobacteria bacterium]|nr:type II secretion system F family protein [Alphaproteobacteria bacterium]
MMLERIIHDPNFLSLVCGAGAFAIVVLIWLALVEDSPLEDRLKSVAEHRHDFADREEKKKPSMSRRERLVGTDAIKSIVQKLKLEQGKQTNKIRIKLAQAGFGSREAVMIYLLVRLALPVIATVVAFFFLFIVQAVDEAFLNKTLYFGAALLGAIGLPELFLKNASQKRLAILRKAMPDALDLMVICAEAGLSLDSSLSRVSREMAASCPIMAEEIGLTGVELGFFPDRSQALQNLADRVPLPGVIGLVNTLIQTEKYGTPLAQALRVLSGEMRNERIMAAETKAAKLPATLTVPMILFILPPLFVVLLGPAILNVMQLSK